MPEFKRADGRAPKQIRPLRFQNHIAPHAAGSTLVEWGNTRVICGVTIEETVPRWMKEQGVAHGTSGAVEMVQAGAFWSVPVLP
jgi:ribonuclease PH